MATRDDILVEPAEPVLEFELPRGPRLAAFLPITVAIVGVIAVLFGGISVRHDMTAQAPAIDMTATGSIANR
jgi:hypothetical protein